MRSSLLLFLMPVASFAQPGTLDPDFGTGGIRTVDVGASTFDVGRAVVVQPDASFILAGQSGYEATLDLCAVRYLPDGTPDPDFGTAGRAVVSVSPGDDIGNAVALQADGKVLIAGYTYTDLGIGFALARLNANGTPDDTFGDNGHVVAVTPGDVTLQARTVGVQADGRIVVAGGGSEGFAIMRYKTTGVPDSTFGGDGLVTIDFSDGNDQCTKLAVQPDGRILLAGYASGLTADSVALARLLPDGSLDQNFGDGGKLRVSYPTLPSVAMDLDLMSDGRFVIAGWANSHAMVARFLPDGTVDNSFNNFGWNFFDFPGSTISRFYGVRVQEDGGIALGGTVNSNVVDMVVAHLLYEGVLNPAFGNGGYTITDVDDLEDDAFALALHDDGGILLAGATNGVGTDFDLLVARYLPDLTSSAADIAAPSATFDVYPVPMQRTITISYRSTAADAMTADLLDATGRTVIRWPALGSTAGANRWQLALPDDLSRGMYTVRLRGAATELRRAVVK